MIATHLVQDSTGDQLADTLLVVLTCNFVWTLRIFMNTLYSEYIPNKGFAGCRLLWNAEMHTTGQKRKPFLIFSLCHARIFHFPPPPLDAGTSSCTLYVGFCHLCK